MKITISTLAKSHERNENFHIHIDQSSYDRLTIRGLEKIKLTY
ncbi:MAG: hypothetical protein AAGC85_22480 [Bacteroidota bacterium]